MSFFVNPTSNPQIIYACMIFIHIFPTCTLLAFVFQGSLAGPPLAIPWTTPNIVHKSWNRGPNIPISLVIKPFQGYTHGVQIWPSYIYFAFNLDYNVLGRGNILKATFCPPYRKIAPSNAKIYIYFGMKKDFLQDYSLDIFC